MAEYLAENSRLRQLSRRHADGQLDQADYRAQRREILEALEAGRTQSAALPPLEEKPVTAEFTGDSTDLRLPDDSHVFYKTMPPRAPVEPAAEAAPAASAPDAEGWDGNTRVLAAVLGVALVIALGALAYVFIL
ncbi:MAG TPA: hypothetical protein VF050_12900 [Moraxellaceae bacterium]